MDTNNMESAPAVAAPITTSYAGFWIRVLAVIIDGILLGVVAGGVGALFHIQIDPKGGSYQYNALSGLLGLAYYTLMESSTHQATLGKMVVGIKVTDLEGNRITLPKAIGRYLAKIVSGIILLIGFIMVAFTDKKQGLHDKLAGTLVVKK